MHKQVENALTELFKAVADVCDGGGVTRASDFDDIQWVYNEIMQNPKVGAFYSKLIDERHAEVYGE